MRHPSPWYRAARNAWYVKLSGKQRFIGEHPKGADKPKQKNGRWNAPKVILDEFHKLMASPEEVSSESIWAIFEDFLDWTKDNRAERTYEFYQERLQRFKDDVPNLSVEQLTPSHVYNWLKKKHWGDTYKRGCITALCRAFNWAMAAKSLRFSPLKGIEKPQATTRELTLTPEQFVEVLGHVKDEEFKDLLRVVWFTGCRPFEVCRLEARHVKGGSWQYPIKESKGKKKSRVIFLIPEALEITNKWLARNPEGTIFRNRRGRPWTAMAFNCRFLRLKEKVGYKINMYALRHSFAHHGVTKRNVDPVVMSALLGHSDTNTLYKVYAHLQHDPEFMQDAAGRVTSGVSALLASASKEKSAVGAQTPEGTPATAPRKRGSRSRNDTTAVSPTRKGRKPSTEKVKVVRQSR